MSALKSGVKDGSPVPAGFDPEGQYMRRLVRAVGAGAWPAERTEGSLTLRFEDRHRRRIRLTTDAGEAVLLDLPNTTALADGDGLGFGDGGWLVVRAAPEDVLDIVTDGPGDLARLAWHLGNRHLPVEVLGDGRLRIAYDHVIEAMVRTLGARCTRRQAPFQPEAGAYAAGHRHA